VSSTSPPDAPDAFAGGPPSAPRPGRPRRYAADAELQLLFDAAFEVMRRNGYDAMTVSDILAEASVSTRSFYRHFSSKDELLQAMFRKDAERFAAAVATRVGRAPNPAAALETWLDEILGFGLGRPRARRAAVFGSRAAMQSLPAAELRRALDELVVPLGDVLRAGAADGTFATGDPYREATLIGAMAWETSARLGECRSKREREELRASLLTFVGRALHPTNG
jgi:AcrR family transcriptional regulator